MTTRKNLLLAVDPGNQTGLAVFVDMTPILTRIVRSKHPCDYRAKQQAIVQVLDLLKTSPGKVAQDYKAYMAIEGQFPGRNFGAVAKVIKSSATWEVLGRMMGFCVLPIVAPATWQGTFKIKGKSEDRKAKTEAIVRELYPRLSFTHQDTADAVLIGAHSLADTQFSL